MSNIKEEFNNNSLDLINQLIEKEWKHNYEKQQLMLLIKDDIEKNKNIISEILKDIAKNYNIDYNKLANKYLKNDKKNKNDKILNDKTKKEKIKKKNIYKKKNNIINNIINTENNIIDDNSDNQKNNKIIKEENKNIMEIIHFNNNIYYLNLATNNIININKEIVGTRKDGKNYFVKEFIE